MKSIIAILLVICLHIISSQAHKIPKIPGPWIVTDIAGKQKYPGSTCTLTILSPNKTTINVNILQRGSPFNQSLLTNVKLCRGSNKVTVKLPSSGVVADPRYYFTIYNTNGLRIDYSATFQIGDPKFGITIRKPVAGDILKIGQTLKASWFGSYVPPGYSQNNFTVVRALLEPAIIPPSQPVTAFNFIPGQNLTFSSGCLKFTLPNSIPRNTLYKFGFLIVSSISPYNQQIYSAGPTDVAGKCTSSYKTTINVIKLCHGSNKVTVKLPSSSFSQK
ncbi:1893_t:CDS:2 [Diversispora eburnea]|uniref:1893_t:CDS:1 n=1 Tax=Diversispora eburnea TaxID=1213867 RepID=A0A9N9BTW0_9GLOM|nr:1893_t:CDS:2 [Diversispora eburnea]